MVCCVKISDSFKIKKSFFDMRKPFNLAPKKQ